MYIIACYSVVYYSEYTLRGEERISLTVKEIIMPHPTLAYLAFIFLVLHTSSVTAAPRCDVEKFSEYQMQFCLYKGTGPLLVLEGSKGNDMDTWPKPFLKNLNQFATVLVYNRIGYGQSYYYQKKKLPIITARFVGEHLHALLRRLKINKPIAIAAHSIGGIYAQYFTRNYPINVAGVVMIDAASSFEPKVNSPFKSKTPSPKGSIDSLESQGFKQSIDQVNNSPPFPEIPLLVITATNHDSSPKIEQLWQNLQRKLVKQSPQGNQVIAEGSGHFVFQDVPDLVVHVIADWLNENHIK